MAPRVIGSGGSEPGQFSFPLGVACDGEALFVADCDNSRIQKLRLAGGAPLGCIGTYGDGNSQFLYPDALCVAAGTVYVWTTDLTWRYTFGREGSGYGKFRHPRGVAVHGNELFMADSGNHRIQAPATQPKRLPVPVVITCCFCVAGVFTGRGRADAFPACLWRRGQRARAIRAADWRGGRARATGGIGTRW